LENKLTNKVLLLMPKPPYPLVDGGVKAISDSIEIWTAAGYDVTLFFISTPKHPYIQSAFSSRWKVGINMYHEFVDTGFHISHLPNLFSSFPYQAFRFYKESAALQLKKILSSESFDFIVFDNLFSAVYLDCISQYSDSLVLLRAHNIESNVYRKIREKHPFYPLRKWLMYENTKLEKWEKSIISKVDGIIGISNADVEKFNQWLTPLKSFVIPVSVKISENLKANTKHTDAFKLFHIGAMDWQPNIEGIQWFISEVFPVLRKQIPNIEFHFAGKSMPSFFMNQQIHGIYCHGEVEDANEFMLKYDALVVPLFSGSGIRIKIIEAMSMGIPVISSEIGISGIPAKNNLHYLKANSVDDYISAVNDLIQNNDLYHYLSENEIAFIAEHYSLEKNVLTLKQFLSLIKSKI
jgi:glycosyltransferase involved in cell wall biosynthesis